MQDKQGRTYAKLSDLKAGAEVWVDGDMTCNDPWSKHTVKETNYGLYIDYQEGEHYLDGQLDDDTDYLVGVYAIDPRAGKGR